MCMRDHRIAGRVTVVAAVLFIALPLPAATGARERVAARASPAAVSPLSPATRAAALAPTFARGAGAARSAAESIHLVPAGSGNEARYRVREQLARLDFPNDAIGTTRAVSGALVLAADGSVERGASRFTVDLTTLQSDSDRRDNYIRRNTLRTEQNPHAVFVPTALEGVAMPLPAAGDFTLRLHGDLTINGVTRTTGWDVTARADAGGYRGTATTEFSFGDFGMTIPRVAAVISVRDRIRLEYDFHFETLDVEATQ
jgi:polyisoprenoid-binding protein YceI